MQFIFSEPLIDQFRTGRFPDAAVGPYFIALAILTATAMELASFAAVEAHGLNVLTSAAVIGVTIFGIFHLKRMNGGTFADGFLNKWFALGWVVGVRLILIGLPAAIVLMMAAAALGGDEAASLAEAIFYIAIEIAYYLWLGSLFEQTLAPPSQ